MTTTRQLITGAFRLINAIQANEEPTAEDVAIAQEALNALIDSESQNLLNIHEINPYRFPLTPGQFLYTLGPTGEWQTERPMRIEQAKMMLNPIVYSATGNNTGQSTGGVNFTFNNNALPGEVVTFTSNGYSPSPTWDLGNGETEIGDIASTSYNTPGVYTVTATSVSPSVTSNALYHFDVPGSSTADSISPFRSSPVYPGAGVVTSVISTSNPLFGAASLRIGNQGGCVLPEVAPYLGTSDKWTFDFSTYSVSGDDTYYNISFDFFDGSIIRFRDNVAGTSCEIEVSGNYHTVPNNHNEWVRWAATLDLSTGDYQIYQNGVRVVTGNQGFMGIATEAIATLGNGTPKTSVAYFDELRVVHDIVYTSDTYTLTTVAFGDITPGSDLVGTAEVTVPGIVSDQNTLFLPLKALNDEQYASIRQRGLNNNWPTVFYDSGDYPNREIFVWPIPTTRQAVELWLWEPLNVYESLDEELNLPQGYERYLRHKLAIELAAEFGKEVSPTVVEHMLEAEKNLKSMNQQIPIAKTSKVFSNKPTSNYITFTGGLDSLPEV